MKIVVSKTSLEKAVKNIAQVINKKCALPILGDIHFKCIIDTTKQQGTTINTMEVMGSDSEVWLRYDLSLEELSEDGEFCVDATMLKNALANLPEQPLELIVQPVGDVANMDINHQTGHTIIPVESADEYPIRCEIDDFRKKLNKVYEKCNKIIPENREHDFENFMKTNVAVITLCNLCRLYQLYKRNYPPEIVIAFYP